MWKQKCLNNIFEKQYCDYDTPKMKSCMENNTVRSHATVHISETLAINRLYTLRRQRRVAIVIIITYLTISSFPIFIPALHTHTTSYTEVESIHLRKFLYKWNVNLWFSVGYQTILGRFTVSGHEIRQAANSVMPKYCDMGHKSDFQLRSETRDSKLAPLKRRRMIPLYQGPVDRQTDRQMDCHPSVE